MPASFAPIDAIPIASFIPLPIRFVNRPPSISIGPARRVSPPIVFKKFFNGSGRFPINFHTVSNRLATVVNAGVTMSNKVLPIGSNTFLTVSIALANLTVADSVSLVNS